MFKDEFIQVPGNTINANLTAGTYTLATCDNNNFDTNIYIKLFDKNSSVITTDGHLTVPSGQNMTFSKISYSYWGASNYSYLTFTIDDDYKINIGLLNTDGTRQVMLLKGSLVERTYTPHKEQTFTFPLGNEKLMLGDYLADDGIHHVRRQITFNGTEDFGSIIEDEYLQFYLYLNLNTIKDGNAHNIISNNYIGVARNLAMKNNNQISASSTYLRIRDDRFETVNDFKTWLQTQYNNGTPIIAEYRLAEEIIVPYTSAQQRVYNEIKNAYSYDEMTIITGSSDGNKPFFIVQTYKDLNKELNNKVDKVQGKELSSNDFTDTLKEKLEGLENYDDTEIKADISDIQEEQTEQNTKIQKLQTENARLKATLPTTGEITGQNITLNKTAELEFKKPPLPMGNSEQESREGYNLFNVNSIQPFNANCNVTITDNKLVYTNNNSYDVTITLFEGELNAGNIYGLVNSNLSREASIYKGNTYYNSLLTTSQKSNSVAINENGTYSIKTSCPSNGSITIDKLLISTINPNGKYEAYGATPSPEFESPITNVTGDVEVVVGNKNLFDKENASYSADNYVKNNNGEEIYNAGSGYTTSFIKVKPNTNYNISGKITTNDLGGRIYFYDINKSWLSRSNSFSGINVDFTFSTPADCNYIQFSYVISAFDSNTVQVEKNSTSTPYTPHKQQVLPLTLGNIELCKIGDYQDYFYKESNKWYLHKEIGKVVLDGSENINQTSTTFDNVIRYSLWKPYTYEFNNIVSTNSGYNNQLAIINDFNLDQEHLYLYNDNLYMFYNKNRISDVTALKTYLSSNNLIVYGILATSKDTEITDTTLISQLEAINNAISYEEQTNISSNTIALFNVEAYQSTKLILKEMATAIVALGGV